MLINMRNGLMAGKRLPYDAEVEYLESTGTQWIDTGIMATSDDVIVVDFRLSGQVAAMSVFGGRISTTKECVIVGTGSIANLTAFFADGPDSASYGANPGRTSPIARMIATLSRVERSVYNVDEGTYDSRNTLLMPVAFTGTMPLYLFRANGNPYGTNWMVGRLFSFRWSRSGVLVRDFIPVRVGNVGAIYDRRGVGGMNGDGTARNDGLYLNRGTGAFLTGSDKSAANGGGISINA